MSKINSSTYSLLLSFLISTSCGGGEASDTSTPPMDTDGGSDSGSGTGTGTGTTPDPEQNELKDLGLGITIEADGPTEIAFLENNDLGEVSGIAASKIYKHLFWVINDGDERIIYAVTANGTSLGQWRIDTPAYDWEDMTSVVIDGVSYLLIGDIGDNFSRSGLPERLIYRALLLKEPDVLLSTDNNPALLPEASTTFNYPIQSYDSESMATDGQSIYFVTKRTSSTENYITNELFKIPFLLESPEEQIVAEHVGTLPEQSMAIDEETQTEIAPRYIGQPTAFEINVETHSAYLLDYEKVFRFSLQSDRTLEESILTGGAFKYSHTLSQAEALTITEDGSAWFTSENRPTPLWVLPIDEE